MPECQKVEIRTIPHRHIASDITNFTSAVCAIVTQMSSIGEPLFTSWANTYSADLYSSYTTVLNFSSSWINPNDTFVYSNSANILQVNTVVNNTSANWNSVYNSYNSASSSFLTISSADIRYVNISGDVMTGGLSSPSLSTNNLYVAGSTINFFDGTGNVIETLKSSDVGNFKSNYTLTNSRSANWENTYTSFSSQSANNISVYNNVNSNSGNWNYQGSDIKTLTGNWQNTYSTVSSYSATWVNNAPQTLTFNNINAELTISGGNTVSLSSLSGGIGSSGVSYLSALNDVYIPSPANGQVLTYSSVLQKWTTGSPASASGQTVYYGSFYDTTAQTLTGANQAKRLDIANTFEANGVSLSGNKIVFNNFGTYEIIFSIQYKNTSASQEDIYIWFRKNGVDIPDSSSVFTIPQRKSASIPAHLIAVTPFIATLAANDFIEIYWHCNTTAVTVETFTTHSNPTIPDTPGVIITVKQVTNVQLVPTVGAYLPLSGGNVTGVLSSTNVIYASGGDSNQWNNTYSTVNSNSATNWNYQGTDVKSLTSNWQNTFTGFSSQSANNISNYTTVNSNSASWGTGGSGSGLTIFREVSSVSGINSSTFVYALSTNSLTANVDLALVAKGTGATLAQIPDGTIVGGNKRGIYATDFQKNRNANSQVASGVASIIVGGSSNVASGQYAIVVGGSGNIATNTYATIGGGGGNNVSGIYSTICGGNTNSVTGDYSIVGGGDTNNASGHYATILGGFNNTANGGGFYGNISGGYGNTVDGRASSISGGYSNNAANDYDHIGGGYNNNTIAGSYCSTIGGGLTNTIDGQYATIAGGNGNTIGSTLPYITIGGGGSNYASGQGATVGGGQINVSSGTGATVAGGSRNQAYNNYATVGGGDTNNASGQGATVGGGQINVSSGTGATVAGGYNNVASGTYSVASGTLANSRLYGQYSHASGALSNRGDAQFVRFVLRNTTTNNTPTKLYLDGSSAGIVLQNNYVYSFNCKILGVRSGGTFVAEYYKKVTVKRTAIVDAITTILNTVDITAPYEGDPNTDASIAVDVSNNAIINILVTGTTGETWKWVAVVEGLELTY
jgi:hypothetical protein